MAVPRRHPITAGERRINHILTAATAATLGLSLLGALAELLRLIALAPR